MPNSNNDRKAQKFNDQGIPLDDNGNPDIWLLPAKGHVFGIPIVGSVGDGGVISGHVDLSDFPTDENIEDCN